MPITRINHHIRAPELRVVGADGSNLGVMSTEEALTRANEAGLDLIEIAPNATPPVAKIMDFGKWQYQEQKKEREARSHAHRTETKNIQIKIGTGEHDLMLKAKKVSAFLSEGHRVKIELFLPGRAKYLDAQFLRSRAERILKLIAVNYKIAEEPKKSPKGLTMIIERA